MEILIWLGVGVFVIGVVFFLFTYQKDSNQNKVEELKKIHSTKMGVVAAKGQNAKAQARTQLITQLNEEAKQLSIIPKHETTALYAGQRAAAEEESYLKAQELNVEALQTNIEQTKANRQLIAKALSADLDLSSFLEVKRTLELNRLELDKQWKQIEQQLKGGFILRLEIQQQLDLLTDYIFGLYAKRKHLEASNDAAKVEKLKLLSEHIGYQEGHFRERSKLLGTGSGENASGRYETA